MSVLTKTVRFVILPVTVVDVAVGVNESPATIGLVKLPVAIINAAIGPNLVSAAMSLIGLDVPLTIILGTILKLHFILFLLLDSWFVVLVLVHAVLKLF